MGHSLRSYLLVFVLALPTFACARCAPGRVGQGLSRLSIGNAGAILDMVNRDTFCGSNPEKALR